MRNQAKSGISPRCLQARCPILTHPLQNNSLSFFYQVRDEFFHLVPGDLQQGQLAITSFLASLTSQQVLPIQLSRAALSDL
jgi:hypothetical protein